MDTIKFEKKETRVIAHRGLSGIETENTLSAFVAAGNRSYAGIETDVHVTKDEQFVVIHDSNTNRVCEKEINVEESTLEEIRSLRLKNLRHEGDGETQLQGNRGDLIVPTLEEYIYICKKYEKKCVLEIKNRFKKEHIKRLVQKIKELDYFENTIFISFKHENLFDLREMEPKAQIQCLTMSYTNETLEKLNKYNIDLDIWDQVLTKEIVEEVHNNGHKINCWTVDNCEDAERLASWGVDYITTNILE